MIGYKAVCLKNGYAADRVVPGLVYMGKFPTLRSVIPSSANAFPSRRRVVSLERVPRRRTKFRPAEPLAPANSIFVTLGR